MKEMYQKKKWRSIPSWCLHHFKLNTEILHVVVVKKKNIPVGKSINSCIASLFPAWLPPLMTLKAGTGRITLSLPARSAMCLYRGTP